jgi:hypothetical protein
MSLRIKFMRVTLHPETHSTAYHIPQVANTVTTDCQQLHKNIVRWRTRNGNVQPRYVLQQQAFKYNVWMIFAKISYISHLQTISVAGLFTALQTKIIACGTKKTLISLGIRVFLGPALMVISSYAIGMRGILLKIAIIQV